MHCTPINFNDTPPNADGCDCFIMIHSLWPTVAICGDSKTIQIRSFNSCCTSLSGLDIPRKRFVSVSVVCKRRTANGNWVYSLHTDEQFHVWAGWPHFLLMASHERNFRNNFGRIFTHKWNILEDNIYTQYAYIKSSSPHRSWCVISFENFNCVQHVCSWLYMLIL